MNTKSETDLRSFLRGYIACALWSSTDNRDESGGDPLDLNYSQSDLSFGSLLSMARECRDFLRSNHDDLAAYCVEMHGSGSGQWDGTELAGHDFWLTRNGHGAGFWDRGLGELGKRLTQVSKVYGSSDIYIGDDGRLYVA